ncbi:pentapeptide repeat-containing protein [Bacillus subtilis]|uniref:pentapeptide repeat-containing protein n=1 Tax=Bacillus subtilis TaxID=1423 RepID=UPI000859AABC|nr:pentapeptide repeat-containing protein [Bacillus subtilis]AOS00489.1 uncharacterized protein BSBS38_04241 [Bacillus subtilis]MDV3521810.1 pentapeptide repeat-containing protein [Bacillus subtilis subsp. subtilis]UWJ01387.1 pentapeptide repeat-containing protein [Bacillus subtilis]WOP27442.1 pentapeptide repeat-containing protein [Bacillus subtilis]
MSAEVTLHDNIHHDLSADCQHCFGLCCVALPYAKSADFAFDKMTDFIGADMRDADLSGADLTGSIFLTQAQVNAANGDSNTKLPLSVRIPAHWK